MPDTSTPAPSKPACQPPDWRQAACRTARLAAHQAAAAGNRPEYWRLLALTARLSNLSFRDACKRSFMQMAERLEQQPERHS